MCGIGYKEKIAPKKMVCTVVKKYKEYKDDRTLPRIRKSVKAYNRSISGSKSAKNRHKQTRSSVRE